MTYERRTLRQSVEFEGLGLHSGAHVKVRVEPGENGIRFHYQTTSWEAIPENVTDTTRSTKLGDIGTIEHMMSALAGLEITDAEIEVSTPEMPGMDGSSLPFYEGLKLGEVESLGAAEAPTPFSRIFAQDGEAKIAIAAGSGRWRYEYLTGERWPGSQLLEVADVVASYPDIAFARTFALEEEMPMIRQYGLGKGLDENSALVLGQAGYVNKERCADEPVRHKLLDAIGDIYLAGIPIRFLDVAAVRTGHTATVKAAALLREHVLSLAGA